jgi:hypothetical protein
MGRGLARAFGVGAPAAEQALAHARPPSAIPLGRLAQQGEAPLARCPVPWRPPGSVPSERCSGPGPASGCQGAGLCTGTRSAPPFRPSRRCRRSRRRS